MEERIQKDLDEGIAAGSRAGDIILIFNIEDGFNSANLDDVYPGWHGGPNTAESCVPIMAAFLGDTRFIDEAMAETFGDDEARLSEVAHFVEELFERAGRGVR